MNYAGNYSLDDFNEGNVVDVRPGTSIRLRHTGFILTLRFRYWNYKSWPEDYWDYVSFPGNWQPSKPQCSIEVELQPQAWGFTGAEPDPEGSILKTVARIQFVGSGRFGEVSWLLIVSALIEAFVLMGIGDVRFREKEKYLGPSHQPISAPSALFEAADDAPGRAKSQRSAIGSKRKSAFKPKNQGALQQSRSDLSVVNQLPSVAVAIQETGVSQRNLAHVSSPCIAVRTKLLLRQVAQPQMTHFEGEGLLQRYLERRCLGCKDVEAVNAIGVQHTAALIEAAEKAMLMLDDHDEAYEMLEKLSKRWRLEEYGFLPETLKTAYL
eukprot:symbB.v1.2.015213.t1/scaffold1104.1/size137596/9